MLSMESFFERPMEGQNEMVRVYSRLLKDTIVCVEDGQDPPAAGGETPDDVSGAPGEERVLYTRSEVTMLQGQPPEALRAVHETKKQFGGRYVGPAPRR